MPQAAEPEQEQQPEPKSAEVLITTEGDLPQDQKA